MPHIAVYPPTMLATTPPRLVWVRVGCSHMRGSPTRASCSISIMRPFFLRMARTVTVQAFHMQPGRFTSFRVVPPGIEIPGIPTRKLVKS